VGRLLIVANRLPVTLHARSVGQGEPERGDLSLAPSTGGLASALRGLHERHDGLWIGWTGDVTELPDERRRALDARLAALRLVPVHLGAEEVSRYYEGFSNSVLWPLLHHFLERVKVDDPRDWEAYEAVNERFAATVAEQHRPGDVVWVHDYQLMLVPELLRRRLPEARIGFFLHTPFPAAEIFRTLPSRERILRGVLGADVVGFHTASYRYHFVQAIAQKLGVEPEIDAVCHDGRCVRLGVYPVGVDAGELGRVAGSAAVQAEARRIRDQVPGGRLVLGVDRLDYTKGLWRRLAAVERLLERAPELRRTVRFVQLAVPSRERVDAYEAMRREVNEQVGRINARLGSVDAVPIHFLYRSTPIEALTALYVAADVMLVTPLRDGMNLVAKEYAATRLDDSGVLVLSELTGAAAEMVEALIVNPYDLDGTAAAIDRALHMPADEQRLRMSELRRRVVLHDVQRWGQSFLDDLGRAPSPSCAPSTPSSRAGAPPIDVAERLREAERLLLVLDYDGTLVPIAPLPHLAPPDPALLDLLRDLASRPHTRVHVASGRRHEELERWLGALPVDLHAEHGAWSRPPGGPWSCVPLPPDTWKADARRVLDDVTRRTPGSLVEEKTASFAWHYRTVEIELAKERLRELEALLGGVVRAHDLELLRGAKVLEVRVRGVSKSLVAARALARAGDDVAVIAVGDDRTDEDLFAALPPSALTIHVGNGASRAVFRLPDPAAVRRFLRSFLS
jgi:trehalose 6-phosphate synthase/phosphatase